MGLIISLIPGIVTTCEEGYCRRDLAAPHFGAASLVKVGRDPMIPVQHRESHVLVKMDGANIQTMHGQAYAIASWDSQTGVAMLRAEGWRKEGLGPRSLDATGVFLEGNHQPNGTVSGFMPNGDEVKVY